MTTDPRVFLIDDDDTYRHSLRTLLESVRLTVEEFPTAQAFLDRPDHEGPGCIVLDLLMPDMDGLELLEAFGQRLIKMPVIVISAHGEIPSAVKSMQLGAVNFLQKPVNHQEFLGCVRAALADDRLYREQYGNPQSMAERLTSLTRRERDVLELIIAGKGNKAIAWDLGTSVRTVETHRANLMRKLQVRAVADLVRLTLPLRDSLPRPPTRGELSLDLDSAKFPLKAVGVPPAKAGHRPLAADKRSGLAGNG